MTRTIPRFEPAEDPAKIADALEEAGCVVVTDLARRLSPELRDLIGYKMYQALGYSLNRDVGVLPP